MAVDDRWDRVLVECLESPRAIEGYAQSGPPIQRLVLVVVEVAVERAIGHELKDKKPMVLVSTVA